MERPQPDTAGRPAGSAASSRVVLAVDDEAPMRRLLVRLLERAGYRILTAPDAAAARQVLAREPVELMLCDLMMPGEPGEWLIQFVSRSHPDVGVVVVTGVAEPRAAERILDLGVLGYLVKPLDKNQVVITVANALRLADLERQERRRREALEQNLVAQREALNHLQDAAREDRRRLEGQEAELRDAAGTVRVLLNQRSADRAEFESEVLENVRRTVQPYLQKLKGSRLSPGQAQWVEALETNLERLVSPFIKSLTSSYLNLTPVELQVADLIRQGRSTKRIAAMLNLSPNTVMTHRHHLREKLGLTQSAVNLRTYLQAMEEAKR